MTANSLSLLTFLAVVTAFAGVYSLLSDLFLRDRSRVNRRVDVEFLQRRRDQERKQSLFKVDSPFGGEEDLRGMSERGLRDRIEGMIEQSGMDLTLGRLQARAAVAGVIAGALVGVLGASILAGLVAVPIGAAVPILHVQRRRRARQEQLVSQVPDAFDLMSRVVRAGQTVAQALQAVSDEFPPPISSEFARCYEQQNLGLSTESALRALARRTGLLEIKIFVLALLVQQQTGGNLAELLDKLSAIVRDRYRIRGQIRTMTAEGRAQASVLLLLPPMMFGLIMLFNWDYASMLIDRPRLLLGCLASEGIGALWIRQIINFDY